MMPAFRFLSGRRNEKPYQKKRSRPIFLKKPVLRQDPFRGRTGQPQTDYQRPGFIPIFFLSEKMTEYHPRNPE